jgi:tRNA(Ile2) C34 agmatinyltransferase TiaS
MNKKANRNAENCPACRKRLTKIGRNGKFRCSNPKCSVVFVRKDDDRKSKLLSRWRV